MITENASGHAMATEATETTEERHERTLLVDVRSSGGRLQTMDDPYRHVKPKREPAHSRS